MTKKLIVGNWKMNPSTLDEAKKFARKIRRAGARLSSVETVICPPFVFLSACALRNSGRKKSDKVRLGAQGLSFHKDGSHTGEVGAYMLSDIGVDYVIVGHSEQRLKGDTDDIVSQKLVNVLESGMTPILCVGENSRDEGGAYLEVLKEQIKNSLFGIAKRHSRDIVLAYEPVWAIGAKEAMRPEQIYEMSLFIKKVFADMFGADSGMKVRVLYGGSVNTRNAFDIITVGKVDGLLVGRDSVNISDFLELLKIVDTAHKTI
ncbi:MAG: triose-phosphate isomerase [Candidatus Taylorbacteria bacterium RIFCSPLOWO2_01_FULL_44_26]|uniref:Triosephosphate isomerase n=1 Tax=Candidatus Taylorbacteria bacterium RIFCSPLOWO2_01_FULL_44_26 TaxID=1802318 RepID=A0A1G2N539_9BACT|nr:MAG: triose-phosphate isomerase [Candidatus Taylorbacteria bacterium RIFCSPLOWO2_01_FULL_44_26]